MLLLAIAFLFTACSKDDNVAVETTSITNQDDDDTSETIDDDYTYKLPVIFHVLYTEDNDSVRALATRLPQILTYVNELYQGNVYGWRGNYSEDINIDFQPALTDEDGNTLENEGVVFEKWSGDFPIEASSFMSSGNTDLIWEPNEYINVMVYPFQQNTKGGIILGISHMPYSINDSTYLDGLESTSTHYMTKSNLGFPYCVSINSTYLYYMSTRYIQADHGSKKYLYNSCDIVATLAHELGHYLGLHHVFTEKETESDNMTSYSEDNDCYDSDYCEDTKSYNKVAYDNKLLAATSATPMDTLTSRTACDGTVFESDNIMDYSIGYAFQFSEEQKQRIRHVLYYSPLIPGPKKNNANRTTRAGAYDGILNLPIVVSE